MAAQVVKFVLDDDSRESFELLLERLAMPIQRANLDCIMPSGDSPEARYRKTPFRAELIPIPVQGHLRISEYCKREPFLIWKSFIVPPDLYHK